MITVATADCNDILWRRRKKTCNTLSNRPEANLTPTGFSAVTSPLKHTSWTRTRGVARIIFTIMSAHNANNKVGVLYSILVSQHSAVEYYMRYYVVIYRGSYNTKSLPGIWSSWVRRLPGASRRRRPLRVYTRLRIYNTIIIIIRYCIKYCTMIYLIL